MEVGITLDFKDKHHAAETRLHCKIYEVPFVTTPDGMIVTLKIKDLLYLLEQIGKKETTKMAYELYSEIKDQLGHRKVIDDTKKMINEDRNA